jgi:hypothetical protein
MMLHTLGGYERHVSHRPMTLLINSRAEGINKDLTQEFDGGDDDLDVRERGGETSNSSTLPQRSASQLAKQTFLLHGIWNCRRSLEHRMIGSALNF